MAQHVTRERTSSSDHINKALKYFEQQELVIKTREGIYYGKKSQSFRNVGNEGRVKLLINKSSKTTDNSKFKRKPSPISCVNLSLLVSFLDRKENCNELIIYSCQQISDRIKTGDTLQIEEALNSGIVKDEVVEMISVES